MSQVQPPNTQTLRPQHLTQVGHEGNPVEFFVDVGPGDTLNSPNPFQCDADACVDLGGPVLYPVVGSGGGGGGGESPNTPMSGGGGTMNCFGGDTTVALVVTGGTGPYTWSSTAGDLGQGTTNDGHNTISPSPNPWSGGHAVAYGKCASYCHLFPACICAGWDCYGTLVQPCSGVSCTSLCSCAANTCGSCGGCAGCDGMVCCVDSGGGFGHCSGCCDLPHKADGCACLSSNGNYCKPPGTPPGCEPCAIQFENGASVTVTDANGNMTTFALNVSIEG